MRGHGTWLGELGEVGQLAAILPAACAAGRSLSRGAAANDNPSLLSSPPLPSPLLCLAPPPMLQTAYLAWARRRHLDHEDPLTTTYLGSAAFFDFPSSHTNHNSSLPTQHIKHRIQQANTSEHPLYRGTMVKIKPFEVEQWMDKYETTPGVLNIAETCAASISIDDLVALCEDPNIPSPLNTQQKLTYGSIRGSHALRDRLSALYSARVASPLPIDNVLITPGAIAANFLLFYTLIGPGDHVICVHPTYQQLYAVPESLGAEVSLWKLRKEKKYIPDIEDLKALVKDNTKMIVINNPNNPTGATIPKSVLQSLVEFAQERDIIILSDEVYRPLFHGMSPMDAEFPPSIISMGYKKAIVTGSMSKAYSLAGIRVGWIATRDSEIIEAVAAARDYTTISVSQLDDQVAAYALSGSVLHSLLKRNINLAKTNVALLETFVNEHSRECSWVKPNGGTTALIKFEKDRQAVDDVQFCLDVLEKTKVMFLPASKCFGEEFKGSVRIGFVCETEVLQQALKQLDVYVREHLA